MGDKACTKGWYHDRYFWGASFAVAMKVAENAAPGSVILCMIADSAERYITTPLFDAIEEDMNAEELALSRSTPGFQIP